MINFTFFITSLLVVLIPGIGVIYTISIGLLGTKKESVIAAFGCTVGIIPHLFASILGLSAILNTSAHIFKIVKIIGIIYLFYIGFGMIRDKKGLSFHKNSKEKSNLRIFVKAILINLLNPKLTLFFFSFLPQFILNNHHSYIYQMTILSIFFMILTLIIFVLYGLLANYLKIFIFNSPNLSGKINKFFGAVFIALAAKLALSDK